MRFMVIIKANQDSEAGKMPDEKLLAELRKSDHIWLVWGATARTSDQIIPGTRPVAGYGTADPHLGRVARLQWNDRILSSP